MFLYARASTAEQELNTSSPRRAPLASKSTPIVSRRWPWRTIPKVESRGGPSPAACDRRPGARSSLKSVMKRLSHARRFIQVQLNHLAILQRQSIRAESL
jgi:hypothetical protein